MPPWLTLHLICVSLMCAVESLHKLLALAEPEDTLPSRLLRQEMDGVLLLSRQTKRARPEAGSSNSDEERGGESIHADMRDLGLNSHKVGECMVLTD